MILFLVAAWGAQFYTSIRSSDPVSPFASFSMPNYVSTKLYKVGKIEFEPRKVSVRVTTELENGVRRQDDIPLATNQLTFLQKLRSTDVLEAKYSKTQKNEYVYEGLFVNGQALEQIYYERMPARWNQPQLRHLFF
ncbi:MAG: hypothetical protein A2X86_22000 [Bdellovibrionales bacterium GWA2_49_15]|nr:MAG: hypothetical protein A2X86_22000 [Bdellovibrionales bacterium GWA2_49_15]HAZ15008.1 hypothetical protein [Bdellovibrionales bacterium]